MSLAGTASPKPLTSSTGIITNNVRSNSFDPRPVGVTLAPDSSMSSPTTGGYGSVHHHRPLGAGLAFHTVLTTSSSSPPPSVMVRSGPQSDNLGPATGAPLVAAYQTVVPISAQPVSVRASGHGAFPYMGPYSRSSPVRSSAPAGAYQPAVGLSPVVVAAGHSTGSTNNSNTYDSLNSSTPVGSRAAGIPGQSYGFNLRTQLAAPSGLAQLSTTSGSASASPPRVMTSQRDGPPEPAVGFPTYALARVGFSGENNSSESIDRMPDTNTDEGISPESVPSESRVSMISNEMAASALAGLSASVPTGSNETRQLIQQRLTNRRASTRRKRNARERDEGEQGVTVTQENNISGDKGREPSKKKIKSPDVTKPSKNENTKTLATDVSSDGDSSPVSCCICLEVPTKLEFSKVNGCKHNFCFSCIETWADRENTCPLCKTRFTKIERVHKLPTLRKRRKPSDGSSSTPTARRRSSKRVRNRDQRADTNSNNALQGLLASFESGSIPQPIAQLILSNVTGGLMTLRGSSGISNQSGPSRIHQVRSSRVLAAGAIPLFGSASNSDSVHQGFSHGISVSLRPNAPTDSAGGGRGRPGNSQINSTSADMAATSAALRRNIARMSQHRLMEPFAGSAGAPGFESLEVAGADTEEEEATAYEVGLENDESFFEQEENYGSFMQRVRNLDTIRDAVLNRIGGTEPFVSGARSVARSYAVNNGDENAGESAANALEIEDSDNEGESEGVVDLLNLNMADTT